MTKNLERVERLLASNKSALLHLIDNGKFDSKSKSMDEDLKTAFAKAELSPKAANDVLQQILNPKGAIAKILQHVGVALPPMDASDASRFKFRKYLKILAKSRQEGVLPDLATRALRAVHHEHGELVPRTGNQFFGGGKVVYFLAEQLLEEVGQPNQKYATYTSSFELAMLHYFRRLPLQTVETADQETLYLTGSTVIPSRGTARLDIPHWDKLHIDSAYVTASSIKPDGTISAALGTKLTVTEKAVKAANHIVILVKSSAFKADQSGEVLPLAGKKDTAKVFLITDQQPKRWHGRLVGVQEENLFAAWVDASGKLTELVKTTESPAQSDT